MKCHQLGAKTDPHGESTNKTDWNEYRNNEMLADLLPTTYGYGLIRVPPKSPVPGMVSHGPDPIHNGGVAIECLKEAFYETSHVARDRVRVGRGDHYVEESFRRFVLP